MKIYIASPYTKGDVAQNVKRAIDVADKLLEMGHIPYVPHLTHFWHIISPKPWKTWIQIDNTFLACCDALLRLDGDSKGSDMEVHLAMELKIPVYYKLGDIK